MYRNEIIDKIVVLLSNYRDPNDPNRPTTLTKNQVVALMGGRNSPNQPQIDFQDKIQIALQELENQGEVLTGKGNQYCIAPPTMVVHSRDNVTGLLLFRGDRAYLSLAHEVLRTTQSRNEVKIHPQIRTFDRIQARLAPVGIRLLTAEDLIYHLPSPQKPPQYVLRCPTSLPELSERDQLFIYQAAPHTAQDSRWQPLSQRIIADRSLLKLTKDRYFRNDQYFWQEGGAIYELEQDVAILAMFDKDREHDSPLRVSWHTSEGKLDLQDIYLPPAYMRYLWQLSGETERYRVRSVPAVSKPSIESALKKLGCLLV